MRIMLAAVLGATALTALPAGPAMAQRQRDANREYREDVRDARREYREDVRDARRDRNNRVRDWRDYRRYDYNRLENGQRRYYADRYYRDGRYYQQRALGTMLGYVLVSVVGSILALFAGLMLARVAA